MRRKSASFCAKRIGLAPNNCCVIELETSPLGTHNGDHVGQCNPFSRGPFLDCVYEPFQKDLFVLAATCGCVT